MSFEVLRDLLHAMFSEMNAANEVPSPTEIWNTYKAEILALAGSSDPSIGKIFKTYGNDILLPQPLEAARILRNLRQRFSIDEEGRRLVGRIRAETVLRTRPKRDIPRESLQGDAGRIVSLTPPHFTKFSQFHIHGWEQVLHTIRDRSGLVIVAPTGSGKTEVFLLPLIYTIAKALSRGEKNIPRFVLLYPRVAL